MTAPQDPHRPSPEFVAALEQELVRELRAGETAQAIALAARPAPRRSFGKRERIAATILIAIGLTVGAGGQIAFAQVQGAQQRSELEREKRVEREILAMRLLVARQERDRALAAVRAGAETRESGLEAEAEVKQREIAMMLIELDLAEIGATSAAPRDELWAPKVGERDFVQERLRLRAAAAQDQLKLVEARSEARVAAVRAGSATWESETETARERIRAQREFEHIAQRLITREQFHRERLSVERVTRQSEADRYGVDYRAARSLLELSQKRLEAAKQRFVIGLATALEVKRAELAVLELEAEVQNLRLQLRAMDRPE